MIKNNEFDTIYHEHVSFFNTKSMKYCCNKNGFSLIDVLKTSIHGGSYVFVLKKGVHDEENTNNKIKEEENIGLFDFRTYEQYKKTTEQICFKFVELINYYKRNGYKIIGYGAAAKGNTFLNFIQIDLDYIVDDNKLKWDLFTAGREIIIKDPLQLQKENYEKIIIVPLAWNFLKEIKQKVKSITNYENIKFITYFPDVNVFT